ncbi:MAG: 23S rRNA (adenine(2503)-C(2))-methyltransferase RlmN [Tenuifilaceae bacterium]
MKNLLLGKSLNELEKIVFELNGGNDYHIELAKCIYKRNIDHTNELVNLPISFRKVLESKYTTGKYDPISTSLSSDKTKKYLFENSNNQRFEAVYMPGDKRNTLCISTQSGCRMGCSFCLTGKIGYNGNLDTLDILNQIYSIPEWNKINRLVIMGMGEPFDNYDAVEKAITILTSQWGLAFGASNITISTVGIKDQLIKFLQKPFCNLAISLHSPFSKERYDLMPIEKSNPIEEIIELLRLKPIKKPLRLSFEYVALGGINTSEKHAKQIGELIKGLKFHVNIICWNNHEGSPYKTPSEIELKSFMDCLDRNNVLASVRESRGQDIGAACGQMAGKA